MATIRLFLAWLVMAALPLQGMAAASMLYCGAPTAAKLSQAASHGGHHVRIDMVGHGHASHGEAAGDGHHGHAHATGDEVASHAEHPSEDTQSHSCAICASCSQAQAASAFDPLPLASPAPFAEPAQPPVRVTSRALTLPDKPPRA